MSLAVEYSCRNGSDVHRAVLEKAALYLRYHGHCMRITWVDVAMDLFLPVGMQEVIDLHFPNVQLEEEMKAREFSI